MSITTRTYVKTILGISGTDQDDLIDTLIPQVEADYLTIRNKPFDVDVLKEQVGIGDGAAVEFTLSKKPIIEDSEDIYVDDSLVTNYSINHVTGLITFDTAPEVVRIEASYETQQVYYPANATLTAVWMIDWIINTRKSGGIASERLADHSITYDLSSKKGYTASIIGMIKRFASFI